MSEQKQREPRMLNGMTYREAQRANSQKRSQLRREDQAWLKQNGYKNVGWINVIKLYQKIEELLETYQLNDLTLEELFLDADRIGNKYLASQEIEEFQQKLSKEVSEISDVIDQQFPDTEIEAIDFGKSAQNKDRKSPNQKSYRTIKL